MGLAFAGSILGWSHYLLSDCVADFVALEWSERKYARSLSASIRSGVKIAEIIHGAMTRIRSSLHGPSQLGMAASPSCVVLLNHPRALAPHDVV